MLTVVEKREEKEGSEELSLDEIVREGVRRMLIEALKAEVDEGAGAIAREVFLSFDDTRWNIEAWRRDYNGVQPHSLTPDEFSRTTIKHKISCLWRVPKTEVDRLIGAKLPQRCTTLWWSGVKLSRNSTR